MPAMDETVTTPFYIVVSEGRIAGLSLEEWIENYKAEHKTESQIQFFPIEENPNCEESTNSSSIARMWRTF